MGESKELNEDILEELCIKYCQGDKKDNVSWLNVWENVLLELKNSFKSGLVEETYIPHERSKTIALDNVIFSPV